MSNLLFFRRSLATRHAAVETMRRARAMPPGPDGPPPPSRNGATRPGELLGSNIPDEIKAGDVLRLYLVYP